MMLGKLDNTENWKRKH